MIAIVALVIVAFMFIWIWRTQSQGGSLFGGQQQVPGGPTIFTIPGSAAAPAAAPLPGAAPTAPVAGTCNCIANPSCNAFCNNTAAFNLCCSGGSSTVPTIPTEPLPEPDAQVCSNEFNGSCNTECGVNGDPDDCLECNVACDTDVIYQGPDIQAPANAGAVQGICNCQGNSYCNQYCNTPNMFNTCCFGSATAAPAGQTPIPPPLTTAGANPTRCKNTYHGKCDTECSSGSQSECNDCMIACGQATAGAASSGGTSGGRTPECKSRYNGSCNTECSSGGGSTCNACRAACGLSANIATVRSASQARHLLNNRLYNSLRAQSYSPYARRVGYERNSRTSGNFFKIGNLI